MLCQRKNFRATGNRVWVSESFSNDIENRVGLRGGDHRLEAYANLTG
ncbi:hypothetical protein RMSM_04479 [Rhodopirellula maiorica SM1]|uniref:Uncharacterized protein n=1 Tax=Rhodopirellula maiorica SM1 TaxID=1265738 RepID=M5RGZ9_9BACT|nr:hypothetical protein RMSM_04479 [Rhodopirellula maiorica SM1]